MSMCGGCIYEKVSYAPNLKARVVTCTKKGKCVEYENGEKVGEPRKRVNKADGQRLDKHSQENQRV